MRFKINFISEFYFNSYYIYLFIKYYFTFSFSVNLLEIVAIWFFGTLQLNIFGLRTSLAELFICLLGCLAFVINCYLCMALAIASGIATPPALHASGCGELENFNSVADHSATPISTSPVVVVFSRSGAFKMCRRLSTFSAVHFVASATGNN